jgi:hypothetical protein
MVLDSAEISDGNPIRYSNVIRPLAFQTLAAAAALHQKMLYSNTPQRLVM